MVCGIASINMAPCYSK